MLFGKLPGLMSISTVMVLVAPNSYAPISQVAVLSPSPSTGRANPRWSVAGGGQSGLPASMAGLPGRRAWVWVEPPLSASGPSSGAIPGRSPAAVRLHVLSLSRLWPADVVLAQFPPEGLLATMVFLSVATP